MFFLVSLLLLFLSVYFLFSTKTPRKSILDLEAEEITDLKKENIESILVMGTDSLFPKDLKGWRGRSDLMVLLLINKSQNLVSLLSIPRDTKIQLSKFKISRINSANTVGGYTLSKRAVQKLLKLKVNHFVLLNLAGFKEVLDSIGPIKIYVHKKMSYHDYSQDLHIEIEAGMNQMDSQELINFLRYRSKEEGDIGRIKRQQMFFRAALRKLIEPEIIFRIPSILQKANSLFLTDMKFQEMFNLVIYLRSLKKSAYKTYIVPGDFALDGTWIVNYEELNDLMVKIKGIKNPQSNTKNQITNNESLGRNEQG
jgi:polyisoprenyl-teichoic acid--peptidoglycan teichoic acid transferase